MSVLCYVTFHPLCWLTNYAVVGTALSPTLTMGMLATCLGISQVPFSLGYQHRSIEVRFQDCYNCVTGPTVGAMERAPIMIWSNPCMCLPTKYTAAKARLISAVGALIHSDVLPVLSLQSQEQECESMASAGTRRDFKTSSLVAWPLMNIS